MAQWYIRAPPSVLHSLNVETESGRDGGDILPQELLYDGGLPGIV